jgi:putative membrane-bound dehydrogenase-like protein
MALRAARRFTTNRARALSKFSTPLVAGAGLVAATLAAQAVEPLSPLTPPQERATFQLADPNLTVELVASEPDIVAPVAIAWDAEGKLYVVEMTDYPSGPVSGRVKLLEDRNGDGRYEKVTVFADQLPFPTGIMPWRGGVLVTAAPDIWFLKDNDGDGVADEKRKVLTGFTEGNQQLRVNGLYWGVDNWIYGANGRSDGDIRWAEDGREAGSIRRRDFRFRPDTRAFEAIAGNSQFGLAHDDWGNRFPVFNNVPVRQVVMEERYVNRAPNLPWPDTVPNIAPSGDNARVYPVAPPLLLIPQPSGYSTSGCGPCLNRAPGLGPAYSGNAFSCEPVQNLITRRRLDPDGAQFVSRRFPNETNREFLAATDTWFHPVFLANGPDGALYVVDFYRKIVEHPHWVAAELIDKINWREGEAHGRLWRIAAKDFKRGGARPRLSSTKSTELVKHLAGDNGWWRDTAHRLLIEKQDRAAIPALERLARNSASHYGRLDALHVLHGLGALKQGLLVMALEDMHPGVRENAVRLCEAFCLDRARPQPGRAAARPNPSENSHDRLAALRSALLALADDPSPRVRFQLALTLGELPSEASLEALAQLAPGSVADRWQSLAVLSSVSGAPWSFLQRLARLHPDWLATPTEAQAGFLQDLSALVGAAGAPEDVQECSSWLAQAGAPAAERLALLAGLADGLARAGHLGRLRESRANLASLLEYATPTALDRDAGLRARLAALRVLARLEAAAAQPVLLTLLLPAQPPELQSAAVEASAELADAQFAEALFAPWSQYARATRQQLLQSAPHSAALTGACLAAVEERRISPLEFDPATRQALRRHKSPAIKMRVEKFWQENADREAVVHHFRPALDLPGDRQRGAATFAKSCLICHTVQGQGGNVGPDLSGIQTHTKETLLVEILDPSRQVLPDYLSYTCLTTQGDTVTGCIVAETAASVTLRRPGQPDLTVPRQQIQELKADGASLMPDGLEAGLSMQDMADLLEFLHHPSFSPAAGAGN